MSGSLDETVTEGLDGLVETFEYYIEQGLQNGELFIKLRTPSTQCIKSNAHALARYASLVQEAKMVPIVEPEVLMDGRMT